MKSAKLYQKQGNKKNKKEESVALYNKRLYDCELDSKCSVHIDNMEACEENKKPMVLLRGISWISKLVGRFLFRVVDLIPDRLGQPIIMIFFTLATLAILPHIIISEQKEKWRAFIESRKQARKR